MVDIMVSLPRIAQEAYSQPTSVDRCSGHFEPTFRYIISSEVQISTDEVVNASSSKLQMTISDDSSEIVRPSTNRVCFSYVVR